MDKQYLNYEFDRFFRFYRGDKSQVSSDSAKLFAEHIAYPLESLVERVTDVCKAKLNAEFGSAEAMRKIENILLSGESFGSPKHSDCIRIPELDHEITLPEGE